MYVDENDSNYNGACQGFYKLLPGDSTYIKVSHEGESVYNSANLSLNRLMGCIQFKISEFKTGSDGMLTKNILDSRNNATFVASMVRIIGDNPYSQEFANGTGVFSIIPNLNTYFTDSGLNTFVVYHPTIQNKYLIDVFGSYKHTFNAKGYSPVYLTNTSSNISIIFNNNPNSENNESLAENVAQTNAQINSPIAFYSYYQIIRNGTDQTLYLQLSQDLNSWACNTDSNEPVFLPYDHTSIAKSKQVYTKVIAIKPGFETCVGIGLSDLKYLSWKSSAINFKIGGDINVSSSYFAIGTIKLLLDGNSNHVRVSAGPYLNNGNKDGPECTGDYFIQYPEGRVISSNHEYSTKEHWYKPMVIAEHSNNDFPPAVDHFAGNNYKGYGALAATYTEFFYNDSPNTLYFKFSGSYANASDSDGQDTSNFGHGVWQNSKTRILPWTKIALGEVGLSDSDTINLNYKGYTTKSMDVWTNFQIADVPDMHDAFLVGTLQLSAHNPPLATWRAEGGVYKSGILNRYENISDGGFPPIFKPYRTCSISYPSGRTARDALNDDASFDWSRTMKYTL